MYALVRKLVLVFVRALSSGWYPEQWIALHEVVLNSLPLHSLTKTNSVIYI